MTKSEIVKYWIEKAESELKSAKVMFGAGYHLYTGYMCHQSIEKILKALYVNLNNVRHPQLHNLKELMEIVDIYSKTDNKQKETVKKLNPLYIKTRYEDYKNKIYKLLTKPYCKKLITETEELFIWIKEFIK